MVLLFWRVGGIEEFSLDENIYGNHAVFPVNDFTSGFNYDLLTIGYQFFGFGQN